MKKVKVGVLGAGTLGLLHAKNLQYRIPNAEVIAICVRTPEKVKRLQEELEIPYGYTDYREMVKNPELEAVVIASSTDVHYAHAMAAMEAGLHVFIEKPTGMNTEECVKLEEAAAKSDKIFTVGFMRRWDPSVAEAKRRIDAGEIGQPILYRGYSLDPVSIAASMVKRAEANGSWYHDMGVHDYDLSRWLLGSEPDTVYAVGGAYAFPAFAEHNDVDNGYALMKFKNGTAAFFYEGRTAPHGSHVEGEVVGTKGTIRINSLPVADRSILYTEDGVVAKCQGGYQERWRDAFINELQGFIDAVLAGKKAVGANAHDGTIATKMGMACQKSFETGDLVHFD